MKIFVAKMNYAMSESELEELFEAFGTVNSVKIIMDRERGQSKGYGFVEMPNDDEGYAAIIALNDSNVQGQNIVVKKSQEKTENFGFKPRRK